MNTKTILLSLLCIVGITTATAQSDAYCWKDGKAVKMEKLDSITFTAPASENPQVDEPTEVDEPTGPARNLAEATTKDIGKIIGEDGKIYTTKEDAEAAGATAVAMIAYVGNASDCTNGLAIALSDESGTKTWSAAVAACSGKTAVTGSTWRLPSIKDWQNMFIGCGASGTVSNNPSSMSYSGLASKLSTAGGTALQPFIYWSSSEDRPGLDAWFLYFGGSNAYFNSVDEVIVYLVRACLAF